MAFQGAELNQLVKSIREKNSINQSRIFFRLEKLTQKPEPEGINPNRLLLTCISEILGAEDLFLTALSIRWGANPNLYVKVNGKDQEEHIVIFLMRVLADNRHLMIDFSDVMFTNFMNYILAMFSKLGSLGNLPAHRYPEDKAKDEAFLNSIKKRVSKLENERLETVNDKVNQVIFCNLEDAISELDLPMLQTLNLLLDIPFEDKEPSFRLEQILLARAFNIFTAMPLSYKVTLKRNGAFSNRYFKAIKARAKPVVDDLLSNGIEMTYFDVDLILAEAVGTDNEDDQIELLEMLVSAVSYGVEIDTYQIKTLQKISKAAKYLPVIKQIYSQPYLVKISRAVKGILPHKLSRLAFNCDISLEKKPLEVCQELNEIYNTPKDLVQKAFEERYYTLNSAKFSSFLKFNCDSLEAIKIANEENSLKKASLVNSFQQVTFEGYDGLYYTFTSDLFKALLHNQGYLKSYTNHRSMELPRQAEQEIKFRLSILKDNRIDPEDVVTVLETYDQLKSPEQIDDVKSQKIKETVKALLVSSGVLINENKVTIYELRDLMKKLGYDFSTSEVESLEISNLWMTFYMAVYSSIKYDNNMEGFKEMLKLYRSF